MLTLRAKRSEMPADRQSSVGGRSARAGGRSASEPIGQGCAAPLRAGSADRAYTACSGSRPRASRTQRRRESPIRPASRRMRCGSSHGRSTATTASSGCGDCAQRRDEAGERAGAGQRIGDDPASLDGERQFTGSDEHRVAHLAESRDARSRSVTPPMRRSSPCRSPMRVLRPPHSTTPASERAAQRRRAVHRRHHRRRDPLPSTVREAPRPSTCARAMPCGAAPGTPDRPTRSGRC